MKDWLITYQRYDSRGELQPPENQVIHTHPGQWLLSRHATVKGAVPVLLYAVEISPAVAKSLGGYGL